MNNSTSNARLTKRELDNAKQILAKRSELTRQDGFEKNECDPVFLSYYHPKTNTGIQIYTIYTAEELLDILISYMEHPGRSPEWDKVHYVYKLYLSWRFGDLAQAKAKARTRQKALEQRSKWPPDWPERVSSEPFYNWLEERGKAYTEEDKIVVESICAHAKDSGIPPDLSSDACKHLGKFGDIKKGLALMNIPPLNKAELRFMARYWKENREK